MKLASLWFVACLLTGALLTTPSHAQPTDRAPRVGFNVFAKFDEKNPYTRAFLDGLREYGYVPGKNIIVDAFESQSLDFDEPIKALIRRKVDIIVATGKPPLDAAKRATKTIPIVALSCDRVDRMARSIARPGGNVTGMACMSLDGAAKRLQLLKEMIPGLSRVAVLYNADDPEKVEEFRDSKMAATALDLELLPIEVRDSGGFEKAFASVLETRPQALVVFTDTLTNLHFPQLVAFVLQNRLPAMYGFRQFADAGGLASFGANIFALHRRLGYFVDKILKGTKPGDIPIEEPTKFELVINARTAKALGLVLPPSILARADELIE